MDAEQFAQNVWAYGSNDDVWTALFDPSRSKFYDDMRWDFDYVEVASELLERIERTPDFVVGDLNHEQVIASILRRYPILGPNPQFGN